MKDILNLLLYSNTLNFLIVVFLLAFLASKLNVKEKINTLRGEIKDYVEESINEKQKAQQDLEDINNKIKELPERIEKIQKSAENSIESIEAQIKEDIVEQKKDIDNNAVRLFNLETKKFKSKLISILSDKSIEIAKENALLQLAENHDLHNKYIDNAINELDRINL
jgi:F0F1-type ATP synthase membrane subunit b/b'